MPVPEGYTRTWYNRTTGEAITPDTLVGFGADVYPLDIKNYTKVTLKYNDYTIPDEVKNIGTGTPMGWLSDKDGNSKNGMFLGWSPYENGVEDSCSTVIVVYSQDYIWRAENKDDELTLYAQYINADTRNLRVDFIVTENELNEYCESFRQEISKLYKIADKLNAADSFKDDIWELVYTLIEEVPFASTLIEGLDTASGHHLDKTQKDYVKDIIINYYKTEDEKKRLTAVECMINGMHVSGNYGARLRTVCTWITNSYYGKAIIFDNY